MTNWLKTITAKLAIPQGLNPAYVQDRVANMIASTIIHEATHGDRWAKFFYTNEIPLNQMNRSLEERMAEDAERSANLQSDIEWDDASLYNKQSKNRTAISNEELLTRAVSIANSKTNFYIPPDRVEDVALPPQAQGMFESVQQQGDVKRAALNTNIAWREADRTLMVDVDKIVQNYNNALGSYNGQNKESMPSTFQEEERGMSPGYTQQSPLPGSQQGVAATPARQSVPARGAR